MHNLPTLKKTALNRIEVSDEWSLHPFLSRDPSTTLQASISRHGILHPPVLKESTKQGCYQLICGRFRLQALQRAMPKEKTITCLILGKETPPEEILSLCVEDQLISGGLSPMEKAYFFRNALQHLDMESIITHFQPILDDRLQEHLIRKSLELLKLEAEIQTSVHKGEVNEKLALELLKLEPEDRIHFHSLSQSLGLGGGKQKRLFTLGRDLARREGKSIATLLRETEIRDILEHPEMNTPQKAANLFSLLQRRLFPESGAAEEAFTKQVKRMGLPKECSISHSQAFERDEVFVTLQFMNLPAVEKQLLKIRDILK